MKRLLVLAVVAALAACASATSDNRANRGAYADFLVGRVANLREDYSAAADRYFAALVRSPATPELIEGALDSSLAGGDIRRARIAARKAKDERADFAMARIVRAADALAAGRWNEARAETRELDGDSVELLTARMISIWANAGDKRTDAAAAEFEAINVDWRPVSGIIQYQHAMMLDLADRRDAAVAAYAAARASQVWLPPAAVREIDLLARMGRASEAGAQGDDVAYRDPDVARALTAAGSNGPVVRTPLSAARGAAIGLYGLGSLFLEEEDYDRGLSLLSLALMLDPQLEAARLRFAQGQGDLGRSEAARAAFDSIASDSPYAETARVAAAWVLRREDRGDEAIAAARSAAAAGGRLAKVSLGDLLRSVERFDEADAAYTEIIDGLNPARGSDWFVYFARGAARERMGRWDLAEADARRALELAPDQPEALNFLGYGWVDRGERMDEGLALIQRAVSLRPQSGHIVDSLGWAYFRMGDFTQALEQLERAVELEPADATLNDHLGDAFWRLGRRVEARYQWNRALSLQPSPTERTAIENKLARGLPPLEPSASAAR